MVVSLFSVTPERAKQVRFSIPYSFEASVLVAPKEINLNELEDLSGLRVAVPRGTIQDVILTEATFPMSPLCATIMNLLPFRQCFQLRLMLLVRVALCINR